MVKQRRGGGFCFDRRKKEHESEGGRRFKSVLFRFGGGVTGEIFQEKLLCHQSHKLGGFPPMGGGGHAEIFQGKSPPSWLDNPVLSHVTYAQSVV